MSCHARSGPLPYTWRKEHRRTQRAAERQFQEGRLDKSGEGRAPLAGRADCVRTQRGTLIDGEERI